MYSGHPRGRSEPAGLVDSEKVTADAGPLALRRNKGNGNSPGGEEVLASSGEESSWKEAGGPGGGGRGDGGGGRGEGGGRPGSFLWRVLSGFHRQGSRGRSQGRSQWNMRPLSRCVPSGSGSLLIGKRQAGPFLTAPGPQAAMQRFPWFCRFHLELKHSQGLDVTPVSVGGRPEPCSSDWTLVRTSLSRGLPAEGSGRARAPLRPLVLLYEGVTPGLAIHWGGWPPG